MNFKVSQLKSLGAGEVAVDDLIYVIDSNPTDGSVKSKKVSVGDLIDSRIYGISSSQFVLITGYYADPSWILSLDWSKIINAPSFVTSLSALTDVQIATPLSGQALVYNGTKWVNQGIGELDTLATVTTRGNTTTNSSTVGGLIAATNLIYTDTVNSRVGINTASPLFSLDVLGTAKFASATSGIIIRDWTAFNTYRAIYKASETPSDINYLLALDQDVLINSRGSGTDIRFNGAIRARFGNAFSLRVIGSGTTSATVGFEAADSSSTSLFQVRDNGAVLIGTTTDAGFKLDVAGTARVTTLYFTNAALSGNITATGSSLEFNAPTSFGVFNFNCSGGGRRVSINGTASDTVGNDLLSIPFVVQNTTGTGRNFSMLNINPTINNTSAYTGNVRGFYYNPTITSLVGTTHRAIETTSGDVILNGGQVGIGTTSPTGRNNYGGGTLVEIVNCTTDLGNNY